MGKDCEMREGKKPFIRIQIWLITSVLLLLFCAAFENVLYKNMLPKIMQMYAVYNVIYCKRVEDVLLLYL